QAVADELLGDEGVRIAVARLPLVRRVGHALAFAEEHVTGAIGDAAVELAVLVAVKGAAGRVGRVLGDAGDLERLAVVLGGVAAAVANRDRGLARDLVEG